ncbi:hypothetical protein CO115_04055 [Candidatus Falkowbacteria bacterium CG_4_9_14_3_um_filter_36_9]|uniref:AbiEi antitoxin C-terminal domain-containing protein n=2 Tax=Candidatus Falkowiibacteriota TaxID=1752728 RepID=A0A1J4T4Y8_9BACT|nr:MAG: hypothetical protein AUJ27_03970 [Candidatus Falkowbacteria bacterium CG1_02_37_44]PIV52141.1 MAG: hypothetical protein COS18_00250 [Candidatus Falkowbacteria bacterium CG02_land_8_20_14_3_00_36_14]PIX10795.1 MAG: hypothetical protein COZ73_04725 [Candidatus Falkowbacteria bacterium CG_4_8_14_3_um_filter_36_11]PJA11363.1 MAG: hypothetical protein COX67_00180 [Candidatus Falkowbacteria bacterium CG_4_10_14_0_2_um_filter_36_22]PJB18614.1 MAG: hypothetical protein CO115_04055 [Candidatus F
MEKINYLQFKKSLQAVGKSYFSVNDLKKFYQGSDKNFKVLLSRWHKKEMIFRLIRGYYAFYLSQVDYLHLANEIDPNSYISFEYALYYYNLIDQVPSVVTLATKKRSRTIKAGNLVFEYVRLKSELCFGYDLKEKIYIASPEKALADLFYLLARGKRIAELDTLRLKKINIKKFKEILRHYPHYVFKKAQQALNI